MPHIDLILKRSYSKYKYQISHKTATNFRMKADLKLLKEYHNDEVQSNTKRINYFCSITAAAQLKFLFMTY